MSTTRKRAPALDPIDADDLRRRRRKAILEAKALDAELKLEHAKRLTRKQKQLMESADAWEWINSWQDVVDRMRDRDLIQPISTAMDRRYGDNWPFWRSWLEHSRLRAAGRILCGMSNQARGLVRGLCSYVIKTGIDCRASAKEESTPEALVGAVQECIDEFDRHNLFPEMQQEIFARDRRDGESFTHLAADDGGMLEAVTFEPEHVLEPVGYDPETEKYGVLTERGNTTKVEAVWVAHDGNAGGGERVEADELLITKANVDRAIKRGLPDFSYDCYDAIRATSRLVESMLEGGAIQAAIPFFRQHDQSGYSQVAEFQTGVADGEQYNSTTGRNEKTQRFYPGMVTDIPKGLNVVIPPFASNAQGFVTVAQAGYRSVLTVWNAPEWLSGDASNNNYASGLVAEAPFTRRCEEGQEYYSGRFLRVYWLAVKARCDAGKMRAAGRTWTFQEVKSAVDLKMEPPKLTVRDPLQEAQREQIEVQMGTTSPQAICAEKGRDYEQVVQDLERHAERTGGMGAPLPLDDTQTPEPDVVTEPDPLADLDEPENLPDAAKSGDGSALRATVGGLTAIKELQVAVYDGDVPREAAIANARIVFGFSPEEAGALFPDIAPRKLTDDAPDDPQDMREGYTGRKKDRKGRTRCYTDGKPTKCLTRQHSAGQADRAHRAAEEHLRRLIDRPEGATPDMVSRAARAISRLTVAEAKALQKSLGIEAKGAKGPHAEAIAKEAARALSERDRWAREARKIGVKPADLHGLAEEVAGVARHYQEQVRRVLADARAAYKSSAGKELTALHKAFRGGDYTDIEGFEEIARTLADRYPELLGAHGYERGDGDSVSAAENLYDLLHSGVPKFKKADAYAEALEQLQRRQKEVPF